MIWVKRTLVLVALALAGFVFGFVPYWAAGLATTRRFQFPDRENSGTTPGTLGLASEDVAFEAPDGTSLKGWWVPTSPAQGTVILVHGLNRSRLEMVRKVPFLHAQGWNALLFDLRHHGESGGRVTTFGHLEKEDIAAARRWVRGRDGPQTVLWGVSLGAASAVLAAADDAGIGGVVADSSYRSLDDTIRHHLRLFRRFRWWLAMVPPWPVADEVLFWIGRRGGFDPAGVDVVAAARRLAPRPALFVCNDQDPRMPSRIAFDLKEAAGERARVLVVPGRTHGGAYRNNTQAYETAVKELLDEVRPAPAVASR